MGKLEFNFLIWASLEIPHPIGLSALLIGLLSQDTLLYLVWQNLA